MSAKYERPTVERVSRNGETVRTDYRTTSSSGRQGRYTQISPASSEAVGREIALAMSQLLQQVVDLQNENRRLRQKRHNHKKAYRDLQCAYERQMRILNKLIMREHVNTRWYTDRLQGEVLNEKLSDGTII